MKPNCVPMKDFAQSVWDVPGPYPPKGTPHPPIYILQHAVNLAYHFQ